MLAVGLGAMLVGVPAFGQIVIGGAPVPARPSVVVDLSVLDGLAPPAAVVPVAAAVAQTQPAERTFTPPLPEHKPADAPEASDVRTAGAPAEPPMPQPRPAPPAGPDAGQAGSAPAPTTQVAETPPPPPAKPAETAPGVAEQPPVPEAPPAAPPAQASEGTTPEAPAAPEPTAAEAAPDQGDAADEPPAETQTAAVPEPSQAVGLLPEGSGFTIAFEPGAGELSESGGRLLAGLAQRMLENEELRLQVRAYAGGTPETASQARRMSLNRALAVRTFLIDRGVRGTRIDVRALGNTAPDGSQDRVDLQFSE